MDIYLVPAAIHTAGGTLKPQASPHVSHLCLCIINMSIQNFQQLSNIMQLRFSLHKGPKYHVGSLFAKRVNKLWEMGLHHVFCFICFYHTNRPSVINKLTDTELIFPATLKAENGVQWLGHSLHLSLCTSIFFIKWTLIVFEIIIHLWQRNINPNDF